MKTFLIALSLLLTTSAFAKRILSSNYTGTNLMMHMTYFTDRNAGTQEINLNPGESRWTEISDQVTKISVDAYAHYSGTIVSAGRYNFTWSDLGPSQNARFEVMMYSQELHFVMRPFEE